MKIVEETVTQGTRLPPIRVKNVLLASDFSPASKAALPYAEAVAALYGSQLYVVHVAESGVFHLLPQEEKVRLLKAAEDEMQAFLRSTAASERCRSLVRGGDPASVLYELGRELAVDLLVLGTNGRRGLKRFVLGSVAEELFRLLPCPALTVGPMARERVPGKPQNVLFATDFEASSLQALPCAASLAKEHQAFLTLLHVARSAKQSETARKELEALLQPLQSSDELRAEAVVRVGEAAALIVEEAKAKSDCLVVLGVRSGGTWERAATHAPGPIAYNVIATASCPVLTIHS